jgi:RNA polymerase sigma-B factor
MTDTIFTDEVEALLADFLAEMDPERKAACRAMLVTRCLPFVERLAKSLARRVNDPLDDLIQVGCIGLMKAIDNYNPLRSKRFKTYVTYLVTGEIRHYLRDKVSVIKTPSSLYHLYYRMNQIIARLTDALGRTPTDLEIAEELQTPVTRVHDINEADRRRRAISITEFMTEDSATGEVIPLEHLVDERTQAEMTHHEDRILLDQALATLKPDLRQVIEMTYFDDLSQMEIADRLGISQTHVGRRLRKGLALLQAHLHRTPADVR